MYVGSSNRVTTKEPDASSTTSLQGRTIRISCRGRLLDLTRQYSVELLVAHFHSVRHTRRHRRIAIRLRSILDRSRHARDPVGLVERDRDNRRLTSHRSTHVARVEDLRMHDLRMQRDLQHLSREPKLLAVLVISPAPAILPTHMSRPLAHRHRPSGHGR